MELKDVIEKRTSIRMFTDQKVPVEDIKEIVRRAGLAPSINNSQPWKFIAITNNVIIDQMGGIVQQKVLELFPHENIEEKMFAQAKVLKASTFFMDAPLLIAVEMSPYKAIVEELLKGRELSLEDVNRLRNYPNIQSIGAAVENLILSAFDLGYGACWLSGLLIARDELEKLLGIKSPNILAACVAIGKPRETSQQREKKELNEIFKLIE
ncbi:MAG: nitroreductase family protein [Ignavibacteriaceae bacterium]|jgi:nitroreductase|nr:nitroreductase family protein [Ignavibacteriaceae bacterium]